MPDLLSTASSAAATANPVGIGLSVAQGALGIIQSIGAQNKINRLMGKRRAYQTQQETYDIVQMAQQASQQGYDPTTMDYLTNQIDRSYADAVGDVNRLGGDPNDIANIFDKRLQAGLKVGAENHNLNMQHFAQLISAKEMLGKNKDAEWMSQQNMIKDELQAASLDKSAGLQNIAGAANTALSTVSAMDAKKLWPSAATTGATSVAQDALGSGVQSIPNLLGNITPSINPIDTSGLNSGASDMATVIKYLAQKLNQPR